MASRRHGRRGCQLVGEGLHELLGLHQRAGFPSAIPSWAFPTAIVLTPEAAVMSANPAIVKIVTMPRRAPLPISCPRAGDRRASGRSRRSPVSVPDHRPLIPLFTPNTVLQPFQAQRSGRLIFRHRPARRRSTLHIAGCIVCNSAPSDSQDQMVHPCALALFPHNAHLDVMASHGKWRDYVPPFGRRSRSMPCVVAGDAPSASSVRHAESPTRFIGTIACRGGVLCP